MLVHHKFCLLDVDYRSVHNEEITLVNITKDQQLAALENKLPKNGLLMTGSMNWTMQVKYWILSRL